MTQKNSFLTRLAEFVVDKRLLIILCLAAFAVFTVFSSGWIEVDDSLFDYLEPETETRLGLDIMEREFVTFGTADIMVENITYDQALRLQEALEVIDGVKKVEFDDTADHFSGVAALFSLTFDGEENDPVSIDALARVEQLLSFYDSYTYTKVGNPLRTIIDQEMLVVDGIAALIVVTVLLLTSRTYAEIPVLLLTFGGAAILNMGTNFLMGKISFVSDSICVVLQLALALDYAIILCHRYMEEHEGNGLAPREAAIAALIKAIPEISSSSLTTVGGLLALCFMEYRLGMDIGLVMIKAILLSMLSVFLLMPGLLVIFSKAIDKTHHRQFLPKISLLGKFAYKTRYVIPPVFVLMIAAACIFSGKVNFVYDQYSVDSIRHNETQLAERRIDEVFGKAIQMAIVVPTGNYEAEERIIEELGDLSHIVRISGLANVEATDGYMITSAVTPREFSEIANIEFRAAQVLFSGYAMTQDAYGQIITNLDNYRVPLIDIFTYLNDQWTDKSEININLGEEVEERLEEIEDELDDARIQLQSEDWARIVLWIDLPIEDELAHEYMDILRGITARYYDEFYIVGDTNACRELGESFVKDNILIGILSVVFVILVLLFTFRSAGLPLLLIVVIQGSIWSNFAIPYLRGESVFFVTYLIISSIQMGSNIDYAIVISSRYTELRETLEPKEAIVQTLSLAFPTVITSGAMLSLAGVAIGLVASNESISTIGVFMGSGTMISIVYVLCVLPQILLLGDILLQKTKISLPGIQPTAKTGRIRIDGRVRGQVSGYLDGEVHGWFRGDFNAVISMGSVEALPAPEDPQDKEVLL